MSFQTHMKVLKKITRFWINMTVGKWGQNFHSCLVLNLKSYRKSFHVRSWCVEFLEKSSWFEQRLCKSQLMAQCWCFSSYFSKSGLVIAAAAEDSFLCCFALKLDGSLSHHSQIYSSRCKVIRHFPSCALHRNVELITSSFLVTLFFSLVVKASTALIHSAPYD